MKPQAMITIGTSGAAGAVFLGVLFYFTGGMIPLPLIGLLIFWLVLLLVGLVCRFIFLTDELITRR